MLKVGDRVYIDGTKEEGVVKDVGPHEVTVHVEVPGGHETQHVRARSSSITNAGGVGS